MTSLDPVRPAAPLPLFYQSPTLLRIQEHAALGVRRAANFHFAAGAAALPLVASEFAFAGRSYPIVFANDDGAMPLAVTGMETGQNLFVDADGGWRTGTYIPGYVRRYPFIGMTAEAGGPTMLGIDVASDRVLPEGGADADLLFDAAGSATAAGQAAMALCDAYAGDHIRTQAFAQALKANGLLEERSAQVSYADAGKAVVQGFQVVNEAAFRALPGPVVVEFHAKGWLDLIVLHLASQLSWQLLLDAASARRQTPALNA
ncbi:SapC family protein [Aquabacter spiritensis]|uniref:SapC protein n=1 Tax=Aquabacter spiritensis TaxID=933073 RepID=A0A4R3LMV5_9HYPH|nr:SapC family protein [Aquabacter spiritensis]TCT01652.1 SapC protein [Aquabacter spiritensis]